MRGIILLIPSLLGISFPYIFHIKAQAPLTDDLGKQLFFWENIDMTHMQSMEKLLRYTFPVPKSNDHAGLGLLGHVIQKGKHFQGLFRPDIVFLYISYVLCLQS